MPTLVKRKPQKKTKPLQKQIDELTETVRHLSARVRTLEPQNIAYIGDDGEVFISPEYEEELERRFQEVINDPSKGTPHSEVKKYFAELAAANKR
jgi:hypothetical protein